MSSSFPPPNNPFPSGGQPPNPFGPPPNPFGQPSQPFGPPGSPPGFPTGGPSFPPYSGSPYSGPSSRLSLLAVVSALFGVGGFFTCCCAPVSLPFSLIAVVTGHMALIFMNRPQSGLTGKPAAAVGLVTGYLGLLLVGAWVVALLTSDSKPDAGPEKVTAATNLSAAESKIRTESDGIAHGNTPAAIDLAKKFSERMKQVRDENFVKGDSEVALTDGNFVTYCELRPGRCAFVVHVPEYRKFEDDAKKSLAELAWEAAQETVAGTLQKGDDLGVGMKGDFLFGSVMVGVVASPDDPGYGLEDGKKDEIDLHPFFEPEKDETAEPPAIELPAEMPGEEAAKPEPEKPVESKAPAEEPPSKTPPDESQTGEPASTNETGPAP